MKQGFSIFLHQNQTEITSHLNENYDDVYIRKDDVEILLEGLILNKKKLINSFAKEDFHSLLHTLYSQKKEKCIEEIDGEFRGLIWNKTENKLFVFTNPTCTQPVFYGKFEGKIFIDSSLQRLSKKVKHEKIKLQPDVEGIYQLLCFGNLLENKTVIDGVYKILDSHFIEIDLKTLDISEKPYFNWWENKPVYTNKSVALGMQHEVFLQAVKTEYEKDIELKSNHLALLSGGLDSRVALLYALKNGLKPDIAFCFSQSGYWDETISRKIAKDFEIPYEFVPLDGGSFLKKIEELTEISEGLVTYTGGIHVQHALQNLRFNDFKIFHSGQIGDGVLGGFNSDSKALKPRIERLMVNPNFRGKISFSSSESLKKFENEEYFLLRNLAFNRTFLGAHVFQQKAYQTSPFMTKEAISFALQIPEAWKFQQKFYLEWINKYCKEATNYRWERTLLKPNAPWKTSFGDAFVKRGYKFFHSKILNAPEKTSMYPYQYYYERNDDIQKKYRDYYHKNIGLLEHYPELLKTAEELFTSEFFSQKAHAIHLISIFKIYFAE